MCLLAFYAINLNACKMFDFRLVHIIWLKLVIFIILILLMCYKVVIFILLLPGFIYRYVQKMNYQIACVISVYIVLKLSTVSNYRA